MAIKDKLDTYDSLECPWCETVTKPKSVNIFTKVVSYRCGECEETFRIDADGDIME